MICGTRTAKGVTQQVFFQESVDQFLPPLISTLKGLGFSRSKGGKPVKVPTRESDLAVLRKAAAQTGLPATSLVIAMLVQACREESKPKARKPRAKAKPRKKATRPRGKAKSR